MYGHIIHFGRKLYRLKIAGGSWTQTHETYHNLNPKESTSQNGSVPFLANYIVMLLFKCVQK